MTQRLAHHLPRQLLVIGMLVLPAWTGTAGTAARPAMRTQTGVATLPWVARLAPPPLGAVPATCPANPPPTDLPHGLGAAIGMSPVWVVGFTPGLSLHLGNSRLLWQDAHGWDRKVGWVVGPHAHPHIELRGWALGTGVPLWFQFGGQAPSTTPVLDPRHPQTFFPNLPAGWAVFPSYLIIPRAGCYVLQASWPGGLWRLAFAAGQ